MRKYNCEVIKQINMLLALGLMACLVCSCEYDEVVLSTNVEEVKDESYLLGGDNTIFDNSINAFSFPVPGLTGYDELDFFVGNSFFNQNWVAAPASATARDGLGPTINALSCSSCHFKDGRGRPPVYSGEIGTGLLMRFSVGNHADGSPIHHPVYGGQLQDDGILGVPREGIMGINYVEEPGSFPDGESYSLRRPSYFLDQPEFGPLAGANISPRVSRQLIGLGLLEAIDETTIIANSDPTDADGDGISGEVNYVWDDLSNEFEVGRFGWKADQPSIIQQVSKAFLRDLGITTSLYPDENCPDSQGDCKQAANGGVPEIEHDDLMKVVLYVSNLGVPAQRDYKSEEVKRGKELFKSIGCVKCHKDEVKTGGSGEWPHFMNQTIRPYTDLLIHDMGEGLADEMPMFDASESEWRTPPLWGIGMFETVNSHTFYLHDGRARNLTEAILWHGGEAESRRIAFTMLKKSDREALLTFLKSL